MRIGGPYRGFSSRRRFLRQLVCTSAGVPLAYGVGSPLLAMAASRQQDTRPAGTPATVQLPALPSPQDDQFLNALEQANFLFFWEQTNPKTGLDERPLRRSRQRRHHSCQHCIHGIWFTALCIGQNRGSFLTLKPACGLFRLVLSLAQGPHPSRILFSLRRSQIGRERFGTPRSPRWIQQFCCAAF